MTELGQGFIESTVQCWACPIFDRMFKIISDAATSAYPTFVGICFTLFCFIFAFYLFGAVWKNLTTGFQNGWFDKYIRPVFINSLVVVAFFGMGIMLPRFITTVTFEPVAYVTQTYSTAMVNMTPDHVDELVPYTPIPMENSDSIFRPELRDAIINTAKVTITQFQVFMRLGVAMLDAGFSWSMFFGIGAFIKHILLAVIGLYLFWTFFKMFFEFLCYFADVIIAMAMFAFFFPLSLAAASFKEISDMPSWLSWIKGLGKGIGVEQIKNMVSAIISLGAAVITYTVILIIIAKFFAGTDGNTDHFTELLTAIQNGSVFEEDLNTSGLTDLTLTSVVVLVFVLSFIYENIPKVTNMILGMFEVSESDNAAGKELAGFLKESTSGFYDKTKKFVKKIINHDGEKA